MAEDFNHEEELKVRQGASVYPIGRALRSTFDAENHHSLRSDITGLMLRLSHITIDPNEPAVPGTQRLHVPAQAHRPGEGAPPAGPGLWGRLTSRLLGR